jgi:hypothetical protein
LIKSIRRSGLNNFSPTRNVRTGSITRSTVSGGTQFILGDFVYQTFTASGTFTVGGAPLVCDALIVAGGGAGGNGGNQVWGGGGGAGGVLNPTNITLAVGSYTVTIGGGGATTSDRGSSGGPTTLQGQTQAVGGGGGGGGNNRAGLGGGSGGGGAGAGGGGGAGTAGQGFAGANSGGGSQDSGGGGGAAENGGAKSGANWTNANGQVQNPGWGRSFNDYGAATSTGGKVANGTTFYGNGGRAVTSGPNAVFHEIGGQGAGGNGNVTSSSGGNGGVVIIRFNRNLVGL